MSVKIIVTPVILVVFVVVGLLTGVFAEFTTGFMVGLRGYS